MEEFKKELDALLIKYPDLPECTLTIRPRVTLTPVKDLSAIKVFIPPHVGVGPQSPSAQHPNDKVELPQALERGITPQRLAELSKSSTVE